MSGRDSLFGGQDDDILLAGKGPDVLFGDGGNDLLKGDRGADTVTGGDGSDIFTVGLVLSQSEAGGSIIVGTTGGSSVELADVFTDFNAGTDKIGLDNGLVFEDLLITQEGGNTLLVDKNTEEFLAVLQNVDSGDLDPSDFVENPEDPLSPEPEP
jgi:Ca2+-binding RTX toxin-like protein